MFFRSIFTLIMLSISLPVTAQVAWKDKVNVSVLKYAAGRGAHQAIEVLMSEPGGRTFDSLCLITATGGQTIKGSKTGMDMIEPVKVKALECGADAIIIRSATDQTVKPFRGGIDQGARLEALAIRYTDQKSPP